MFLSGLITPSSLVDNIVYEIPSRENVGYVIKCMNVI